MKVNSVNNQSFGMNLKADSAFWAGIGTQIWNEPKSKISKKILKQIQKIEKFPLKDSYEIQKVSTPVKKEVEKDTFKISQKTVKKLKEIGITFSFLKDGYKLVDKTTNKTVLKQTNFEPLRKYYNPKVKQADFINTIAKNLKKLAKLEKLN